MKAYTLKRGGKWRVLYGIPAKPLKNNGALVDKGGFDSKARAAAAVALANRKASPDKPRPKAFKRKAPSAARPASRIPSLKFGLSKKQSDYIFKKYGASKVALMGKRIMACINGKWADIGHV
jgi:hypothetical protein